MQKLQMNREILKIIAMLAMALDHFAMVGIAGTNWKIFGSIGRIAFPIFAFQVAIGFLSTHNKKKYLLTMFLFALISEIPYNLAVGRIIDPFSQNVMFTFSIAILMLLGIEKFTKFPLNSIKNYAKYGFTIACFSLIGILLGFITFVDYFGPGVTLVIGFYLILKFPQSKHTKLFQLIACFIGIAYFCNSLGGLFFVWNNIEISQQMFGVFATIPIGLYLFSNKQKILTGKKATIFKYFCYAFYPIHLLLFVIIAKLFY